MCVLGVDNFFESQWSVDKSRVGGLCGTPQGAVYSGPGTPPTHLGGAEPAGAIVEPGNGN